MMTRVANLLFAGALLLSGQAFGASCVLEDANFATADGGCKDQSTGLVWSGSTWKRTQSYYSYSGAVSQCANLDEGGFSDWRLPSKDEMLAVEANDAHLYLDVLQPAGAYALWTNSKKGNKAYTVNFDNARLGLSLLASSLDSVCVRP